MKINMNINKIPLVLVSGLLSDKRVFQHQVTHLKNLADIVVIDLNDVASPAAMVEKILSLAPPRFALAGHSIGGWVSLRLMKIAPEKIIKLCLLNTSARGIDSKELIARQSVLTRTQNGEFQQIVNEIATQFTFNQDTKKEILEMFLQVGEPALINQTNAMMIREDLSDVLHTIQCPTLIIHAAKDKRFSLEVHEEIEKNIPNSKLAIIDDCGHMSPIERPCAVTTLMRYWLSYS